VGAAHGLLVAVPGDADALLELDDGEGTLHGDLSGVSHGSHINGCSREALDAHGSRNSHLPP
jgi:hypothetical protein